MEENNNALGNSEMGQEEFGVTAETKSRNSVSLSGGFNKVVLTKVQVEEVGKTNKFVVLSFNFIDLEGNKSYKHSEFIPDKSKDSYDKAKNGFNVRIKHIYETYAAFPQEGLGRAAKSWQELFNMIANAFNTNNGGAPVYQLKKEDKMVTIPVWIKNTYSTKGALQFPLSPNFIEKITGDSQAQPKTLSIDKRYDTITQPDVNNGSNNSPIMGGVVGGAGTSASDFGFE